MINKNFTLNFDALMNIAKFRGPISEMQKAISKVQDSLSELELPKELNAKIRDLFSNVNSEIENFEDLTSKSFHSLSDISEVSDSFERIIGYYKQIEKYGKEITGTDKEELFSGSVVNNIKKANKALQT